MIFLEIVVQFYERCVALFGLLRRYFAVQHFGEFRHSNSLCGGAVYTGSMSRDGGLDYFTATVVLHKWSSTGKPMKHSLLFGCY